MNPMFDGRFEAKGTFLGTIKNLQGHFVDLWVCEEFSGSVLVMRYGNEPEDYSSATLPSKGVEGEVSASDSSKAILTGMMVGTIVQGG